MKLQARFVITEALIATFRLAYGDDYECEFTILSIGFRLAGQKFRWQVLGTLNLFS